MGETITPASEKIVRGYFAIAGLYTLSMSLVWGVNTLFLLDAGLELLGVFIANAVFTASAMVFEVPTGVVADTRGRRVSFLLSVAILATGTVAYLAVARFGGGLGWFCVASVVLGLGYTFYSGAVEAWLVDALKASGFAGKLDQVFARGAMVTGGAMLLGTVIGGLLGSVDLSLPFAVRVVLLAMVFAVAWYYMRDLGFSPRPFRISALPKEISQVASASVSFGWRRRSVRLLIVAGMFQSAFVAWGFHAWQPYFLELLGQNLVWVAGVIAALVAAATIVGNLVVEWLSRYCGFRSTLLIGASVVLATASVLVGFADSFYLAVGLYLLSMSALGVLGPVRQAYLHQVIPSAQRATVISFDSLAGSGASVLGQGALGTLAQMRSIASGFAAGGLITLAAVPVLWMLRRLAEPADHIVGSAGKPGACAGQGLPEAATVDTLRRQAAE